MPAAEILPVRENSPYLRKQTRSLASSNIGDWGNQALTAIWPRWRFALRACV